jgi:hypothetical protein
MTRATFLALISSAIVGIKTLIVGAPKARTRAMIVDVRDPDYWEKGPGPGTRVILDGIDVSNRCHRAELTEDGTLMAYLYKWDKQGKPYYDRNTREAAKEILIGKGEIILPEAVKRSV